MVLNVLHILASTSFYGAEEMLLSLTKEQAKQNINVKVLILSKKGTFNETETIFLEEEIPVDKYNIGFTPSLSDLSFLKKYCANLSIDVVHTHGYKSTILCGLFMSSTKRKYKLVTTLHGHTKASLFSKLKLYQILEMISLNFFDSVITVSESVKNQISLCKNKSLFQTIPNGIRTTIKNPVIKYISPFHSSSFKMGSLGRFCKEKNFKFLILLIRDMLNIIPNVQLVIFGEGPEKSYISKEIYNYGLEKHIFLPGYLYDKKNFFNDIDVYINCSTTEGMPVTILEAFQFGVPVVASNIPANNSLMTGLPLHGLISNLDTSSYIKNIIKIYNYDSTQKLELKNTLKAYFLRNYTSDIMEKRYRILYEYLINQTM